jgi:hypothetical protein
VSDKPISFDFKLRLGSKESTAALAGRATGELVQLQPIDWDSFVGLHGEDDERTYQGDREMQSIIVELANQIAVTSSVPVVRGTITALSPQLDDLPTESTSPVDDVETEIVAPVRSEPAIEMVAAEVVREAVTPEPAPEVPPATVAPAPAPAPAPTPAPAPAPVAVTHEPAVVVAPIVTAATLASVPDIDAAAPAPIAQPDTPAPAGESVVEAAPIPVEPLVAIVEQTSAPVSIVQAALPAVDVIPEAVGSASAEPVSELSPTPVPAPAVSEAVAPVPPSADPSEGAAASISSAIPPTLPAPPPPPASGVVPVVQLGVSGPVMMPPAASAVAPTAPAIAPLALAKIERRAGAARPTTPVDFHALLGQSGLDAKSVKKRKKRHPFKALFKLVLVLAVLGGGLYAGKRFVLDQRWSSGLQPLAEEVAAERTLEFTRAVPARTLPASEYIVELTTDLLGLDPASINQVGQEWRALGVAQGDVTIDGIGARIALDMPAFYDPVDATIYVLENAPEDLVDLAVNEALAMALTDQHFGWGERLLTASPAARTAILTVVRGDARSTAAAVDRLDDDDLAELTESRSAFRDDLTDEVSVDLPEFATALVGLDEIGRRWSDGVLGIEERDQVFTELLGDETDIPDDGMVYDLARDRATTSDADSSSGGLLYWYGVLASRIPAADAWSAATAWEADDITIVDEGSTVCVEAVVTAVDVAGAERLLGALQQWAAGGSTAAPPGVSSAGERDIKVRTCDPGPTVEAPPVASGADPVPSDVAVTDASVAGPDVVLANAFAYLAAEADLVARAEPAGDDERVCTVAAVRGFGLVGQALADPESISGPIADIANACA